MKVIRGYHPAIPRGESGVVLSYTVDSAPFHAATQPSGHAVMLHEPLSINLLLNLVFSRLRLFCSAVDNGDASVEPVDKLTVRRALSFA